MGKRQHESNPPGFYIKKFIDAVESDPAKEPQDFDRALFEMKQKHSPDNESNAYLFWTHGGLSAWAIFYRAKKRANRHHDILLGLKKAMRSFENEKIEVRTSVAKGINGALPLGLRTKYQNHSSNLNKRQRTIDITTDPAEDQHALADDTEAVNHSSNPNKRQRTIDITTDPAEDQYTLADIEAANHLSNLNKRQHAIDITTDPAEDQHALADDIEAATDTFQDNIYYRLSSPQASKAQNLFPEILFNILSQDRPKNDSNVWTAGIEMAFAVGKNFDNKLDSIMSLTIVSNQVAFLAKHLFDVHIMSTEDRRYVHDNGTGMDYHPRPEMALYGCKREVILETFGETIASAITASPAYREEKRRCRPRTGCVNMTFTAMVNDVAIINLYMAEKESFWVKQALWGK